jgi:hypothetical protein
MTKGVLSGSFGLLTIGNECKLVKVSYEYTEFRKNLRDGLWGKWKRPFMAVRKLLRMNKVENLNRSTSSENLQY